MCVCVGMCESECVYVSEWWRVVCVCIPQSGRAKLDWSVRFQYMLNVRAAGPETLHQNFRLKMGNIII